MHSNLSNLDLTNKNLWEGIDYVIKQSGSTSNSRIRTPIPDFPLQVFQRDRVMKIQCHNPVARSWWKLGCYVNQVILGTGTVGSAESTQIISWRVPLYVQKDNKRELIFFPDPAPITWRLSATIPHWHEEVHLILWRYTGPIVAPLIEQVSELQSKSDQILARLQ